MSTRPDNVPTLDTAGSMEAPGEKKKRTSMMKNMRASLKRALSITPRDANLTDSAPSSQAPTPKTEASTPTKAWEGTQGSSPLGASPQAPAAKPQTNEAAKVELKVAPAADKTGKPVKVETTVTPAAAKPAEPAVPAKGSPKKSGSPKRSWGFGSSAAAVPAAVPATAPPSTAAPPAPVPAVPLTPPVAAKQASVPVTQVKVAEPAPAAEPVQKPESTKPASTPLVALQPASTSTKVVRVPRRRKANGVTRFIFGSFLLAAAALATVAVRGQQHAK